MMSPSMCRRLRRSLRWLSVAVLLAVLVSLAALLGVYGYHGAIVSAAPGELAGAPQATGRSAQVDVFIATGGVPWMSGHNSVAACVPFGMVRLGPDTENWLGNQRCLNRSGYCYSDNRIIGFSHTRLVGADAKEGGVFRVFPTVASDLANALAPSRFAAFSHAHERAFPGYYGVQLDNGIVAEMTATTRVGIHRYLFPEGESPVLLVDAGSALGDGRTENVSIHFAAESGEITGSARIFGSFSRRYGGLDVFFAARVSGEVKQHRVQDQLLTLEFAAGEPVELQLALSYVSIANAKENLATETAGNSFADTVAAAEADWEEIFSRIDLEGGSETEQRIFYTALMRAFTMPTTFSDTNGQYVGFDKAIHTTDGFTYYTDFSIWDTFRTVHPLYSLIAPREHTDMLRSLAAMVREGGALPRWPSGTGYTNCMFGTPADILVSEAYQKGLRDFDAEGVYAAARSTATSGVPNGSAFSGRQGLAEYLEFGYCPSDIVRESVACTLDYAWCDGALALWAHALGKEDDAVMFQRRSEGFRHVWNPETQFFQGRTAGGDFDPNLRPLMLTYLDAHHEYTDAYVEGSAMQWRWGTPYSAAVLVDLWPTRDAFVTELQDYLDKSNTRVGWWNPGGHYWHGNEPFIHAAYLFNAAGRPDLTQTYVRRILATKYSDDHIGLDGNDDGGTLSAWYVLSSLGFYPVAGTTRYELGSPLFTRAVINLGNGHSLTVSADGHTTDTVRVDAVHLNGKPLTTSHFTHAAIAQGGELHFQMAAEPKP